MRIVDRRNFAPRTAEMIVGRKLASKYPYLAPGLKISFGRRKWKVVGIFSDGGSQRESEVWTDLDLLSQDIPYGSGFASLRVLLKPCTEKDFKHSLASRAVEWSSPCQCGILENATPATANSPKSLG